MFRAAIRFFVRMSRVLPFLLAFALAGPALGRNVLYVDNARAGGFGTYDKPFATLAEAEAKSAIGDIIYVGEGSAPYEEGIALQQGQMLIGAAYGLDAVRVDFKSEFTAPPVPAVQGPGPTIQGSVSVTGDNVVAGCTLVADAGTAFVALSPHGPVAVRKTFFRTSKQGIAVYLLDCSAPVTFDGGGIAGSGGTAISIVGGAGEITFERFPIGGTFGSAVSVHNRGGGAVTFRNSSKITIDDATRGGIVVQDSKGTVAFESPVRVTTHGTRAIFAKKSDRVIFSGGGSRVATTGAIAFEVQDTRFAGTFESISGDGIVINKLRGGKLTVTGDRDAPGSGGTIRNAANAVDVEQSSDIQLSAMNVDGAVYLRHLSKSKLSGIAVSGGGITAGNIEGVSFDNVSVVNAPKGGIVVQEAIGTIPFTRCTITDPAGAALVVEQKFNSARLSFDRGEISAANRPAAAPYLIEAHVAGAGKVQLEFNALRLHDSAGSAILLDAAGTSVLSLVIAESYAQRLGGTFLDAAAHDAARLRISLHDTNVNFQGSRGRPLVSIDGGSAPADSAQTCIDVAGTELIFGGGAPPMRIAAAGRSQMQIVGAPPAGVEIIPGTAVLAVASCR